MLKQLVINDRVVIPATEIEVSFARSSGPGGQNVNKVESKVEVRWRPAASESLCHSDREWLLARLGQQLTAAGELLVTSQRTRDQAKNREDALAKLAALVRAALVRPRPRKATRPSRGARERRLRTKRHRAQLKGGRRWSAD